VIARNGILLSTGYNGALGGEPHCDEVGHKLIGVCGVLELENTMPVLAYT